MKFPAHEQIKTLERWQTIDIITATMKDDTDKYRV
jgi:hypothetical protein